MPPRRKVFDAVIRHRTDVQKYSRAKAHELARFMGVEDARLLQMLRQVLPSILERPSRANLRKLASAISTVRAGSFGRARARLLGDLVQLAESEAITLGKMFTRVVGVPVNFNPVDKLTSRRSVTRPFGHPKKMSLDAWFKHMERADHRRILASIQASIAGGGTTESILRGLAGTARGGFADGVLGMARRELEGCASTGANHVANAAMEDWVKANQLFVERGAWSAILDDQTCGYCSDLDGEVTDEVPPAHGRCRCGKIPVFDLDAIAEAGGEPP